MDLATFEWLLTDPGQVLLGRAMEVYADAAGDPVVAAGALRRIEPEADRATAALSIVTQRVRAVTKFGDDAMSLYFTPEALEQSTRRRVADHRAQRLALARPESVVDLGCGIGGDLIAVARAGLLVAGVDLDPLRAAMAKANLDALGLPGATMTADVRDVDVRAFGAAIADPARRDGRGRVFDVEGWSPPWAWVTALLAGQRSVVKVAPGIPHDVVPPQVEAEWVSEAGEVKEAALWGADLATTGRRATVLGPGGLATLTDEDDPYAVADRPVGEVAEFLYEPDGAVIRAGLVTAVAAGVAGHLLDPHIAYVSSDAAFRTPFARGFRVDEEVPFREKALRAALRERGIGRLTIKKRGVDITPETLRNRLSLRGEREATLVLTRVAGAGRALLVTPL